MVLTNRIRNMLKKLISKKMSLILAQILALMMEGMTTEIQAQFQVKRNNLLEEMEGAFPMTVHELELRVKLLEAELREVAAIEMALYSSLAEHGSSAQKVHTPARRLSRMYIHASRQWPTERMTSAALMHFSILSLITEIQSISRLGQITVDC